VRAAAEAQRATLRAAAAGARNARLNLDYCTIRAPIAGRTGSLLVHPGNVVKANDAPLVVIQELRPINVAFAVPERHLPDIRRHAAEGPLAVRVTAPGDTGSARTGTLTFVDNAVDETTGTIRLKGTFPNTDEALWPGQFVPVSLVLGTRLGAVVVPVRALQRGQQGDFLYVVEADLTARVQPITVGPRLDDQVVVEEGLEAGERVVTDGQLRLTPGAWVEETPGAGAAAAP
jgi:multidrug efflux system membrane fusion protein